MITTSLLTGVLLFATTSEGITERFIMGGVGLILGPAFYAILNEMTVKRRFRRWVEDQDGPVKDFTCEVELNQSGLHVKQNGIANIVDWDNIQDVEETQDSVDIYLKKTGLVVVRNRAFMSPNERVRFIELANQYVKTARNTSPTDGAR